MIDALYDEEYHDPDDIDQPAETFDLPVIRRFLIRLAQIDRERDEMSSTKAAIVARYDERDRELRAQAEKIRDTVRDWIERFHDGQKVSFPDVGTAFLRKTPEKIRVDDADLFRRWALAEGLTKSVLDETSAKKLALEHALQSGELVPGVALEPAGVGLTVKGVA